MVAGGGRLDEDEWYGGERGKTAAAEAPTS
jgi:hypothetical protein